MTDKELSRRHRSHDQAGRDAMPESARIQDEVRQAKRNIRAAKRKPKKAWKVFSGKKSVFS